VLHIENALRATGIQLIAGVDEAGRGPCAGPLVVAAVILKESEAIELRRVKDSKALTSKVREELFAVISREALAVSIIEISPQEIDEFGLHVSNLEGMRRAIHGLSVAPDYVLIDGYAIDGLAIPNLSIWKGDQVAISISAASIVAKVHRDRIMISYEDEFPGYGFAQHKGYITAAHTVALKKYGPSPIHRRSFANIVAIESTGVPDPQL
jgi:ribonuclease HII